MTGLPDTWDARVLALGGGILQSRAWAEFQSAYGRPLFFDEGESWLWSAALRTAPGIRYLFCGYGPVAGSPAALVAALGSLRAAAKRAGADFVRFEPAGPFSTGDVAARGARSIGEIDPRHSWILDLDADEAELRAGLSSGHRNEINGAGRRGLSIRRSDGAAADVELLVAMLSDTAKRAGVTFHPPAYFRAMLASMIPSGAAALYVAERLDPDATPGVHSSAGSPEPVSAAVFYDFGGTRSYAHAGAFQELNRKAKASVALVWRAILDAKAAGMKTFDFWGVAPGDDPSHKWAGISKFKKAFGGRPVEYSGTWDLPVRGWKYGLYALYRKLKGRTDQA